ENELRAVRFRDRIRMTLGHAVRPDDLIRLLRQEEPTIVHFSGHGSPNGIVMRSESGGFVVSGESLRQVFFGRNVRMVVLSSCVSSPQASALKEVVPAVIGTSDELDDEAARRFSAAFYRTLGNGYSYGDAFRDGQDAVAIHQLNNVFVAHGDLGESLFAKAPNA
ncbi:MAG: CHAT domain-containing protein, partial [Bryobacteraceae bacterium]